jgi:transposase
MRPLLRLLRFVLKLQGAVVMGGRPRPTEDAVEIRVRRRGNAKPRCPECRRVLRGKIARRQREWRHLDLIRTRTIVVAEVREGYCNKHGRRVERVPWAAPASRHTHAFDGAVASLVQVADKTAAHRMFRVAWRTVGRIVERVVADLLPEDRFESLELIGIDETSYKRGHRYLTVVINLITGRVVWLGKGKSAKTLVAFFEEIGPERSRRIKMVAMDMSEAYKKAVDEYASQAAIVYDRFHVVKLLLEAIDEIRREEVRGLEGDARKELKNTRYALFRNPKRHMSKKDHVAIERIRRTNKKLARAYELRCDFEELWELRDPEEAKEFLMNWTRSALLSKRPPLRKFANTIRKHLDGVLGFFKFWGTTSGVVEGTNNKIKLAIHRAFGFHSIDALMSMVYLCCGGLVITW